MSALLSILSSFLVGLVLTLTPWTSLWDSNYLLAPHPVVRAFLLSAFTRGAVTGLGLVNIVMALHEMRRQLARPGEPF